MKSTAFLSVALACAFATPALSQSKFEKATASAEKLEKKAYWDFPRESGKNGGGYAAHYPTLGAPPKKVALVTIAFHDPGYTKSNVSTVSTVRTPDGRAQIHIDNYAAVAAAPIKESFAKYGMQVLTPDEFLDTDAKKAFYNNFTFSKARSINKLMSNIASSGTLVNLNLAATGYREMVPNNELVVMKGQPTQRVGLGDAQSKETLESLGYDLAKGLGVDAVLIVFNTHHTKNQVTIEIDYVTMALMGPNPVQLSEDDKKPLVYRKGVYYAACRVPIGTPTSDKNNPMVITNGYANIMTALSNKIGKFLVEKTADKE